MSFDTYSIRDIPIREMKTFSCGTDSMDRYLYSAALHYDVENEAKTWVIADKDEKEIAGYYTLKSVSVDVIDENNKRSHIPAVEIARVAIDKSLQGNGNGKGLIGLIHTYLRNEIQSRIGVKLAILFAIPNKETFYKTCGYDTDNKGDYLIEYAWDCENCIFMYTVL